jgi:hypothetical protein
LGRSIDYSTAIQAEIGDIKPLLKYFIAYITDRETYYYVYSITIELDTWYQGREEVYI